MAKLIAVSAERIEAYRREYPSQFSLFEGAAVERKADGSWIVDYANDGLVAALRERVAQHRWLAPGEVAVRATRDAAAIARDERSRAVEAERLARWKTVESGWSAAQEVEQVWLAQPPAPGVLERAASFATAMLSRGVSNTKVEPRIFALRQLSCFGGGALESPPCPSLRFDERLRVHYCGDCGCGARAMTRLSSAGSDATRPKFIEGDYIKLQYPALPCPRRRPGFSNS